MLLPGIAACCQTAALPTPGCVSEVRKAVLLQADLQILLGKRGARKMSAHHFQQAASAVLVRGSGVVHASVWACGSIWRSEAEVDDGAYDD